MLTGREIIIHLSLKYKGDWNKIYDAIRNKEPIEDEENLRKEILNLKCKTVTILDKEYPEAFTKIYHPPFVLYYYGDISLFSDVRKNVSVVGSRNFSSYGEKMTIEIVKGISPNYNIVSGLAKGIDSIAHETAIAQKGKTIAILGSGIDYCYPKENISLYNEIKKNHLLVSEYPNNSFIEKDYFPNRNRLIAASSRSLIVTEAKKKSGTMITVNFALEIGNDIMCVPYPAGEESGCNSLIKEGVYLVENFKDVLDIIEKAR